MRYRKAAWSTALLLAFAVSLVSFHNLASAQEISSEFRQKIERLLDVAVTRTMVADMVQVMGTQTYQRAKRANPEVPEETLRVVLDTFEELFKERLYELLARSVPIFTKYFDENEVEEALRFYESPVGRKFTELTRWLRSFPALGTLRRLVWMLAVGRRL